MKIRQSTIDDLKRLMHIYGYARTLMAANGNANQWINRYPSEDLIRQEIANGHSWVCLDENGIIVGTFCLIEGEDPSYAYIEEIRFCILRHYLCSQWNTTFGLSAIFKRTLKFPVDIRI